MGRSVVFILINFLAMASLAQSPAEILKATDRAFSQLSLDKGMAAAFLEYADEEVIKLNHNQFAIRGKAELEKWLGEGEEDFKLEWKPLAAEIAASQDLGYTFGCWRLRSADGSFRYGEYVTVWKRQDGGNWKFVLDGGNPTPPNPGAW